MKLSKQMWLVVAIILIGIAAAGLILKTEKPAMDADGHSEHAAEVGGKDEHGHAAIVTESVKGLHGGKLFKEGGLAQK